MTDYAVSNNDEPARSEQARHYPVEFHGKGGEYFKIWIVNILLSILTLYIYSAWAKVRSRRYFYGNTLLDKSPFEYHATGKQLLLGRLIGLALFIFVVMAESLTPQIVGAVYLCLFIFAPWAIWRSTIFNARVSSYRNIRFGFTGKVGPYYWYLLVVPFLPMLLLGAIAGLLYVSGVLPTSGMEPYFIGVPVALGFLIMYLLAPYVHCKLSQYTIDHYQYGRARFDTELSVGRFYMITLKSLALLIVVIAVLAGVASLFSFVDPGWIDLEAFFADEGVPEPLFYLMFGLAYAIFLTAIYLAIVFYQSRVRNYLYRRTLLSQDVQPDSTVSARGLLWLTLSNMLIIIFTLGLGYPWAAVRKARYFARHTAVWSPRPLDGFVADQQAQVSAMGEEIGEALDMDLNIGL